ncbi:hypothetical protein AVEN_32832-1 [Araneus ventricosus]|uniref:Uncharacterized protein n=1 Tax=Araneus ventricosus TaxID=182803 RepID=A0A4Y2DZM3_ARAVE|nr:hypothetical protein AVEN_32832-1 [Araneus ventricosus]
MGNNIDFLSMDHWLETGSLKYIKISAKPIGIDVETSTSKSAEEDSLTAAVQAGFSDESLTADATELPDLELSDKMHSSTYLGYKYHN